MSEPTKPNFVLVGLDASATGGIAVATINPATEALKALSIDTPAKDIASDQMKEFQRVFARQFGEF